MKTLLAADLVLSALAFALYAWDKRASRRGVRRVPERTLHLVALLGGWPGALLARRVLRHKTLKPGFRLALAATVAVNVSLTLGLTFLRFRTGP